MSGRRAHAIHDLHRLLHLGGQDCKYARYMARALSFSLRAYARGAAEDAAIWARRAAECYALYVLELSGYAADDDLLYGMMQRMPYSATELPACYHAEHVIVARVAHDLGAWLSREWLWGDFQALRSYGGTGAHAHTVLRGDAVALEPLFVPMLRVCLSRCGLRFSSTRVQARL